MYFLKHKALTGTIENNSKPNNNSDIFYRCDVLDEAGRFNGHFTLGVKGSRAYLLRLKLEHYTDFDLDKILRFAKRWGRKKGCSSLRVQLKLSEAEYKGEQKSCRVAMINYARKQGHKDSYYWVEYMTLAKEDVVKASWLKRQLKTIDEDGGIVLPKGYRYLRFSELTSEQWEDMLVTQQQYFHRFVHFDAAGKPTPEYSFAIFKGDIFVAYITFRVDTKNSGSILAIGAHRLYPGGGAMALKCFVYTIYKEITDIEYFNVSYTRACTDGKRMLTSALGGKYVEYTYLRGYDKKI